jgi:hypothetical protein
MLTFDAQGDPRPQSSWLLIVGLALVSLMGPLCSMERWHLWTIGQWVLNVTGWLFTVYCCIMIPRDRKALRVSCRVFPWLAGFLLVVILWIAWVKGGFTLAMQLQLAWAVAVTGIFSFLHFANPGWMRKDSL